MLAKFYLINIMMIHNKTYDAKHCLIPSILRLKNCRIKPRRIVRGAVRRVCGRGFVMGVGDLVMGGCNENVWTTSAVVLNGSIGSGGGGKCRC